MRSRFGRGIKAGREAADLITRASLERLAHPLRVEASWSSLRPAPLVEVGGGLEVGTGRPGHDCEPPIPFVREVRRPRRCRLQHVTPVSFERPSEKPGAALNP